MSEDRSNEEKSTIYTFEHQESYQKIQFKFFDAVESMDHNNIIVSAFPVNIRRYLDVDSTLFARYGRQMDVKTMLCPHWVKS